VDAVGDPGILIALHPDKRRPHQKQSPAQPAGLFLWRRFFSTDRASAHHAPDPQHQGRAHNRANEG
jgi:hypothetical protein